MNCRVDVDVDDNKLSRSVANNDDDRERKLVGSTTKVHGKVKRKSTCNNLNEAGTPRTPCISVVRAKILTFPSSLLYLL